MNKNFKPGQICEQSGKYDILNNSGEKTTQLRTVVKGEPFPPTPKGEQTYQLSNPPRQDVESSVSDKNEEAYGPRSSRKWLFLAIATSIFFVAIFSAAAVVSLGPYYSLRSLLPEETADGFAIGIFIVMTFFLLVTLPIFMVTSYHGVQIRMLKLKIKEDLWLCGLESKQLDSRMKEFRDKNSFGAFAWPAVVSLAFSFIIWGVMFMPLGYSGIANSLNEVEPSPNEVEPSPNEVEESSIENWPLHFYIGSYFVHITNYAKPVTWAFLGAYVYILMVLIRRWLHSDLTSGVLWKLNVRVAVALIIGLLLMSFDDIQNDMIPAFLAFTAGIVPDSVLRWLSQQMKKVVNLEGQGLSAVFKPSELQNKIDGLNFWQADRLSEEGIECVQDLATKEIPNLLINTRFDTPKVLYWVDQALLCMQVDVQVDKFKHAFVRTASDLLELVDEIGVDAVCKSIQDAHRVSKTIKSSENGKGQSDAEITSAMIKNVVLAIKSGPNLPYVQEYWKNTNTSDVREDKLAELYSSN